MNFYLNILNTSYEYSSNIYNNKIISQKKLTLNSYILNSISKKNNEILFMLSMILIKFIYLCIINNYNI